MATKPTLKKIEQIANNEEAAVALFNDNFNTLEEVIQDSVSRSGKVPTNMLDNLDMGDKRIINLGKAVGDNDAVRYKDVKEALKESQNAKKYAQNAENAAIRADASAALADTSKREAQTAAAGAKTSEDNAQMIYDELITNEAVATVHENIVDVKTVAADIANVNTTATNIEDIKAVFDIAKRICYGNIGDISATAANIAPDGCRFLDGAAITREEFPDAFKMLDEGTLPAKSVAEYEKDKNPRYSVSGLTVTLHPELPTTFNKLQYSFEFTLTRAPANLHVLAEFLGVSVGIKEDRKILLGGWHTGTNESEQTTWAGYYGDFTLSTGVSYKVNVLFDRENSTATLEVHDKAGVLLSSHTYDRPNLVAKYVDGTEYNSVNRLNYTYPNSVEQPFVSSVRAYVDDQEFFNGTKESLKQGNTPFFGFDEGSDTALLPVANDIFLEASDVHAAWEAAGLPGLGGSVTQALLKNDAAFSGVFSKSTIGSNAQDTEGDDIHRYSAINFDASASNSVYGNSDTVQPEALKYRHYIVLSHREQMLFTIRDSVKAYKDLPKTGNINGDIRMVTDQGIAYIWCRYSRDVWGWSSIGQYLTITAPGKFAWGALGGDLRAQTDLYERLQIPSRAIAGSGILFSEEKGGNYKEYLPAGDTGPFGFSEDGSYLTSCPPYGTLMLDQIDFTKDFTCNIRLADFNTNAIIMAGGFGLQSYLLFRKADPTITVQLYASPYLPLTLPSSSLTEDEVDIRVSKNANNITLSVVLPSTGEVIGEVSRASSFYQPANALYLGNRPQYGVSANNKINLKGTWVEQDGVKTFAYEDIEDPKTIIEVEDYDKIMKNVSKGSTVVLTNGNTTPNYMGSLAYGIGSVNYINNYAIGFGSNAYAYGQKGVALGYNAKAIGEGSFQFGEGANKEAFTLQFRDTPIVVENKLASASLPLVAGEGITLEAGAPRKAYHVVGSPQVNDNILTVATTEDEPSYLMSDPREYSQKSLRSMTLQLALKNVGVHKGSSTSYSEDSVFKFVAPFATKGETKYNNWNILNVTVSEYYGIRVYGIISGSIALSQVEGRDVLIEVSIGRSSPWTRTLRYSLDDGASWTVVQSEAESDEPVYVYYPTLQIGRCASYYSTYGRFTGSFDLSKTFFTDHVLGSASFNFEMTKPSNELVISADIPEDIGGGAKALEDIAAAGDGITFSPYAKVGYTVNGSPTISEDLVASDFSSSSYLLADATEFLDFSECSSFELVLAVSASSYRNGMHVLDSSSAAGIRIGIVSSGGPFIRVRLTEGSSSHFAELISTTSVTDQKLFIKLKYDSTTGYELLTSSDGASWNSEATSAETRKIVFPSSSNIYLGRSNSSSSNYVWLGNIYLEDTYLIKDGEKVWVAYEKTDKTAISTSAILNTATKSNSIVIGGQDYIANSVAIGVGSKAGASGVSGGYAVALGYNANAGDQSAIAIGYNSAAFSNSIAIGTGSATGSFDSVSVGASSQTPNRAVALGYSARITGGTENVAIGYNASSTKSNSVVIGSNAILRGDYGVTIGSGSIVTGSTGVAIGYVAKAQADYAIQLGYGTNTTANTFNVGLSASLNVQLLNENGDIPAERMMNELITIGSGAPTTATEGFLGKVYIDSTNSQAYICVGDAGTSWTWKQITA